VGKWGKGTKKAITAPESKKKSNRGCGRWNTVRRGEQADNQQKVRGGGELGVKMNWELTR